jgi:CAAD domains of cyanobacterial aminoacyl-tRNA synthetase
METQVIQQEYIDDLSKEAKVEIRNSVPVEATKQQSSTEFDRQVEKISKQISDFFIELPEKVSRFYQEYKFPVVSFALLVVTIVTLRVGLAIVGAINDIPLVEPFFEFIGIGYTVWFAYRYLLKDSTRKELAETFGLVKKEIVGKNTSEYSSEL